MSKPKKFLIGQLGCFGDILYATTIAKQIKHDYKDSHITWAVQKKYKSILDLNPHIDEIWVIENPELYVSGWKEFEKEAIRRKNEGIYDELIFSQIGHFHYHRYDGTIRSTTLNSYKRGITVDVSPVVRLSQKEIENVRAFSEQHKLSTFKEVILFECSPGSGQSDMNFGLAWNISKEITKKNSEVCVILSTLNKVPENDPQIISGKELSFRENAELTKYCTLLVGCSSGITWLSTSDWAKKLPMIQILNKGFYIFAGIKHDFAIWNIDSSNVVEMLDANPERIIDCLQSYLQTGIHQTKQKYDELHVPALHEYNGVVDILYGGNYNIIELIKFGIQFKKKNQHLQFLPILKYPIIKALKKNNSLKSN